MAREAGGGGHCKAAKAKGEKKKQVASMSFYTNALTHMYSSTHSLTHTHLQADKHTHSFTPSLLHSFTPSLLHSFTHLLRFDGARKGRAGDRKTRQCGVWWQETDASDNTVALLGVVCRFLTDDFSKLSGIMRNIDQTPSIHHHTKEGRRRMHEVVW